MANILCDFNICHQIPQNIKTCIKFFHVFNDYNNKKNIIFATNKDKVYGLGSNQFGCLGFGHMNEVKECTEIKELSNHKIVELFTSVNNFVAITYESKLFVWGCNDHGQLGLGHELQFIHSFKPIQIEFPNTEMIEDIKCGLYHTLILLTNGLLYGWGCNGNNELGFGDNQTNCSPKMLRINETEWRFKYIYCFNSSSFAVTTNGELFSWGLNTNGILGDVLNEQKRVPERIDLINVHKICSNGVNTYFLTNEGLIYFCGKYEGIWNKQQNAPKIMNDSDIIIRDLPQLTGRANENVICVDSNNLFYTLNENNFEKLNENYESFIDLYAKLFEITPQTVHISSERPEHYFIIEDGIEVYPLDHKTGQKTNDLVEHKLMKQNISKNSISQNNELQDKFDGLESKFNKLSQDLENETIRNNYLTKSLEKANEEIKELKLQIKNSCSEGYEDLNDKPK